MVDPELTPVLPFWGYFPVGGDPLGTGKTPASILFAVARIEDHNLASAWELLNVPLPVYLALLTVRWSGEGHNSEDPGTHALCDGSNRATFSSAVPSLEDNNDAQTILLHRFLHQA